MLIIRCLVKEGGRTPPPYPSVFIKPSTSIAGFQEDVPIPKIAQDGTVDYEGELVSQMRSPLFLTPSVLISSQ